MGYKFIQDYQSSYDDGEKRREKIIETKCASKPSKSRKKTAH